MPVGIPRVNCLNFVLVGNVRSGTSVVQSALSRVPGITCHTNLISENKELRDASRAKYFGELTPAYDSEESSVPHYLNSFVFDRPRYGEKVIGVRLTYDQISRHGLLDFFREKEREGDFCVVHVIRNPFVCLVSQKQAVASGLWGTRPGVRHRIPRSVTVDVSELVEFVRESERIRCQIQHLLADKYTIPYRTLLHGYHGAIVGAVTFLNLSIGYAPASIYGRLRNAHFRARVNDFDALMTKLPEDVRTAVLATPFI